MANTGWFLNGLDLEWDLKFGKPNHLKSRQIQKKNVPILNGPVYNWLGIRLYLKPNLLKTGPFKIQSSKSPDFNVSGFQINTVHFHSQYHLMMGVLNKKILCSNENELVLLFECIFFVGPLQTYANTS